MPFPSPFRPLPITSGSHAVFAATLNCNEFVTCSPRVDVFGGLFFAGARFLRSWAICALDLRGIRWKSRAGVCGNVFREVDFG